MHGKPDLKVSSSIPKPTATASNADLSSPVRPLTSFNHPYDDAHEDDKFHSGLIAKFVRYCAGTEIPPVFAIWSAVGGISCLLHRNCFCQMGMFQIYCNQYVCLVARSGGKKSTSANIMKKLILTAPLAERPNLIAQKSTPEALFDAMRQVSESDTTLFKESCVGFLFADELSTFLNRGSYESGMPPLLTKLYDCDDIEYQTKARGKEVLTNTCLGILGATTIDFIAGAFPENAVGGGVTSRIIFAYSETIPKPVSRPDYPPEKMLLWDQMIQDVLRISQLTGPFYFTKAATEYYDFNYVKFKTDKDTLTLFDNPLLGGYLDRRGNHLLKTAMIVSAAERSDRIVTIHNIRKAESLLSITEVAMPRVIQMITSNETGSMIQRALNFLKRTGSVRRQDFIRYMANKITAAQSDQVIQTLTAMGKCSQRSIGNDLIYEYKDEPAKS